MVEMQYIYQGQYNGNVLNYIISGDWYIDYILDKGVLIVVLNSPYYN